jgi:hypothetical protein
MMHVMINALKPVKLAYMDLVTANAIQNALINGDIPNVELGRILQDMWAITG